MKKRKIIALLLIILSILTGCSQPVAEEIPELLEPVGIQMDTVEVTKDSVYQVAVYEGQIVPYVEQLQFAVDGILEQLHVHIGDTVTQGQVLATLNEEQIQEQMNALESEMYYLRTLGSYTDQQLKKEIRIAQVELERLEAMGAPAYECELAQLQVTKMETKLEQNQESRALQLRELQRQWNGLDSTLGNNQIVAPFDGVVVSVSDLSAGDRILAYTTVLCVADESRLRIQTDYVEAPWVESAAKILVKLGTQELDVVYEPMDSDEYTEKKLRGETVYSYFTFDGESGVDSGAYVLLMLYSNYKENVLTVPAGALYRSGGSQYVYKIIDGERVRCDVKVGMITETRVEILEGLQEGDEVYVKN